MLTPCKYVEQFFTIDPSEDEWKVAVKKAFKFSFDSSSVTYTIRSIKKDEVLMKAGDPAEKIFILKKYVRP